MLTLDHLKDTGGDLSIADEALLEDLRWSAQAPLFPTDSECMTTSLIEPAHVIEQVIEAAHTRNSELVMLICDCGWNTEWADVATTADAFYAVHANLLRAQCASTVQAPTFSQFGGVR